MASHECYAEISILTCPVESFRVTVGQEALREDGMNVPDVIADKRTCRTLVQPVKAFAVDAAQFYFDGDDVARLITHALPLSGRLSSF